MNKIALATSALLLIFLNACNDKEDPAPGINVPTTYSFTRDDESTVSFSGQTDRLNMLSEIKSYLGNGDAGNALEAAKLNNMFSNENDAFTNSDLNASSKQLEDKTFLADVTFYKDLFEAAEAASEAVVANDAVASAGVAGRIQRGNGNYVLVNEKGWEFTQVIEKGLMGSVFLHQIYNTYLTDDRIGSSVDNTNLVDGANYTAKEHHFDEAFGYWGVPVDFPSELPSENNRFWANYSYGRESLVGSVTNLKNAFLAGRTAIVNNDEETLEAQVAIIYEEFEIVAAATAIHYINSALTDDNEGDFLHHVSEAYAFVRALKFSEKRAISDAHLSTILNSNFGTGGDFWTIGDGDLAEAKSTLASVYPRLSDIQNEL
ncbi:MAG: DUF4856 domain-containing protein [Cyclobacteriaceae bacterium]|nr:DUF4856 domain-containing protein [Cyclobacteriaceae bacterium SS2]